MFGKSSVCACGAGVADVEHLIMNCNECNDVRKDILLKIGELKILKISFVIIVLAVDLTLLWVKYLKGQLSFKLCQFRYVLISVVYIRIRIL